MVPLLIWYPSTHFVSPLSSAPQARLSRIGNIGRLWMVHYVQHMTNDDCAVNHTCNSFTQSFHSIQCHPLHPLFRTHPVLPGYRVNPLSFSSNARGTKSNFIRYVFKAHKTRILGSDLCSSNYTTNVRKVCIRVLHSTRGTISNYAFVIFKVYSIPLQSTLSLTSMYYFEKAQSRFFFTSKYTNNSFKLLLSELQTTTATY